LVFDRILASCASRITLGPRAWEGWESHRRDIGIRVDHAEMETLESKINGKAWEHRT
jgi:hypothetical protein